MKQTKELFEHGFVTSNGGRGKLIGGGYANGTAYVKGTSTGGWNASATKYQQNKNTAATTASKSSRNKSTGSSKAKEEFKETIDWIEVMIDRIERKISEMDTIAGSVYKLFTTRNSNLVSEFSKVREEIDLQNKAYQKYYDKAHSLGVSESYMAKIRNGELNIEDIKDEDLHKKISEAQDWYDKALDCLDTVTDLKETLGDIVQDQFDLVATQFELQLEAIEHETDMISGQLDIIQNKGNFAGKSYYEALIKNEEKRFNELEKEYNALIYQRNEALSSGAIVEGSEAALEMANAINDVAKEWQDAKNNMLEYKNDWLEMDKTAFSWMHSQIQDLINETEFLNSLIGLNENDLFDKDTGRLNGDGMATGAMDAMAYNVLMHQADSYRKKVDELNAALAKDPTNTILIDARNEYLQLQREAIQNANEEKKAIQELVSNQYDRMLEALSKIIDKRKEALQAERDLYEYQHDIEEKSGTVKSLQKQLMSLEGDDSEEAGAKRQEVRDQLKDAQHDLESTEYDKWIQDQELLLDKMYSEYERVFNERLDDINGLLMDMIDYGNSHTADIQDVITNETQAVGYTITEGMKTIWFGDGGALGKVMTDYTSAFNTQMTNVFKYVNGIYLILKETTKTKVDVDKPKVVAQPKPAPKPSTPTQNNNNNNTQKKTVSTGSKINAGSAPIYWDSTGKVGPYGSHQYFAKDPVYFVVGERNGYVLARHHTQSAAAGWFKKSDVVAMNTGGYTGNQDGFALLHKKERILTSQQTEAFDKLVYDYLPKLTEEFMSNSGLGMLQKSAANYQSSNSSSTNNINIDFNLPNVKDANDFINELQKSKDFEKLVSHIAFDPLNGKSSLRKNLVRTGRN